MSRSYVRHSRVRLLQCILVLCGVWWVPCVSADPGSASEQFAQLVERATNGAIPEGTRVELESWIDLGLVRQVAESRASGRSRDTKDAYALRLKIDEAMSERAAPDEDAGVTRSSLWFGGADRWRLCEDSEGSYFDCAVDGSSSWGLADSLEIALVPSASRPPPGRDYQSAFDVMARDLNALLTGGVSDALVFGCELVSVEESEGSWLARMSDRSGEAVFEFRGSFDESGEGIVVERSEVVTLPGSLNSRAGYGRSFEGWDGIPEGGTSFPVVMRTLSPAGLVNRTLSLLSITAVTEAQLDAVLIAPRAGEADAVRGELPDSIGVWDYASGVQSYASGGEGQNERLEVPIPEQLRSPSETGSSVQRTTRVVAIVVAAVVTLVVIRLAMRRGGSS